MNIDTDKLDSDQREAITRALNLAAMLQAPIAAEAKREGADKTGAVFFHALPQALGRVFCETFGPDAAHKAAEGILIYVKAVSLSMEEVARRRAAGETISEAECARVQSAHHAKLVRASEIAKVLAERIAEVTGPIDDLLQSPHRKH